MRRPGGALVQPHGATTFESNSCEVKRRQAAADESGAGPPHSKETPHAGVAFEAVESTQGEISYTGAEEISSLSYWLQINVLAPALYELSKDLRKAQSA